jgi:hypothetical protein
MLNNILLSYLLFVLIIRCFSGVPVYSVLREIEPFDRAKYARLKVCLRRDSERHHT